MNNESIRIRIVYVDDRFMWVNDEVIKGLYTIDKSTFKANCVINSYQLNRFGKFEIRDIYRWKNKVIVLPNDLKNNWIVYDLVKKELQYKKVVDYHWEISGLYAIEEKGFLLPGTSIYPIIVVDFEKLTIIQEIKGWNKGMVGNEGNPEEVWTLSGVVANSNLFFYVYNTKYIIKTDGKNIKRYFIKDIPFGIISFDFINNQFWILPQKGNYIYVTDEKFNILENIELVVKKRRISASFFSRIIATERYIFLLPVLQTNIFVYDKQKQIIKIIYVSKNQLKNRYPLQCDKISYWATCIDRNKIFFMPLTNKLLIVDLSNLRWEQRDIFLPTLISNFELKYWLYWNKWIVEGVEKEETLKIFFRMVQKYEKKSKKINCKKGDYIWGELLLS